jgi:hypothetical protein
MSFPTSEYIVISPDKHPGDTLGGALVYELDTGELAVRMDFLAARFYLDNGSLTLPKQRGYKLTGTRLRTFAALLAMPLLISHSNPIVPVDLISASASLDVPTLMPHNYPLTPVGLASAPALMGMPKMLPFNNILVPLDLVTGPPSFSSSSVTALFGSFATGAASLGTATFTQKQVLVGALLATGLASPGTATFSQKQVIVGTALATAGPVLGPATLSLKQTLIGTALATSAAYMEPAIGGPISFLLYDDFSRYTSSTNMNGQPPLIGPNAWSTTGAAPPTIVNGNPDTLQSTGTGYCYTNFSTLPTLLGCRLSATATGAEENTLAWAPVVPMTIHNLLHFQYGTDGFDLSLRLSDAVTFIMDGSWNSVQTANSFFDASVAVVGNVVTVIGPAGELFAVADPNVLTLTASPYSIFCEPSGGGAANGAIWKIWAFDAFYTPPSIGFDHLNPNDASTGSNVPTLTGSNLTITGNSTNWAEIRGLAGRTNGKVHFEVKIIALSGATYSTAFGIASKGSHTFSSGGPGGDFKSVGIYPNSATNQAQLYLAAAATTYSAAAMSGHVNDVYAIEVDFGNMKLWFKNVTQGSNWNNSGSDNPATNTGGYDLTSHSFSGSPWCINLWVDGSTSKLTLNTGGSAWALAPSTGFEPWLPANAAYLAKPIATAAASMGQPVLT